MIQKDGGVGKKKLVINVSKLSRAVLIHTHYLIYSQHVDLKVKVAALSAAKAVRRKKVKEIIYVYIFFEDGSDLLNRTVVLRI